jgi:hypothetical protein
MKTLNNETHRMSRSAAEKTWDAKLRYYRSVCSECK